jgi:pimeloyl-ACP methyl ester carboxylesterase
MAGFMTSHFNPGRLIVALVLCLQCCLAYAAEGRIGVVLMHGKWGTPARLVDGLAGALRDKGFLVATPLMPWGRGRDYDADYPKALEQIAAEAQSLRQQGAATIVVAGHSFGANAALAYAAGGADIAGIVMLAPGHTPERRAFRERLAGSVDKARAMLASGKADEKVAFDDLNQGRMAPVWTTPKIYLSYFDPEGLGAMPKSAAAIKKPLAILWVVGTRDPLYGAGETYAYDKAPAHPKSKFLTLESDHFSTPRDATAAVVSWIESLKN